MHHTTDQSNGVYWCMLLTRIIKDIKHYNHDVCQVFHLDCKGLHDELQLCKHVSPTHVQATNTSVSRIETIMPVNTVIIRTCHAHVWETREFLHVTIMCSPRNNAHGKKIIDFTENIHWLTTWVECVLHVFLFTWYLTWKSPCGSYVITRATWHVLRYPFSHRDNHVLWRVVLAGQVRVIFNCIR